MAKCRSCGASIIWARFSSGRRAPVDARPTEAPFIGNIELSPMEGEAARAVVVEARSGLYTSHFATCPNANQWRRAK